MLSRLIVHLLGDIVCSKTDKSLSMTRLAACTAHFLSAILFVYWNLTDDKFNWDLWLLYLGFATGHAVWDKSWMTTKGKEVKKDE